LLLLVAQVGAIEHGGGLLGEQVVQSEIADEDASAGSALKTRMAGARFGGFEGFARFLIDLAFGIATSVRHTRA